MMMIHSSSALQYKYQYVYRSTSDCTTTTWHSTGMRYGMVPVPGFACTVEPRVQRCFPQSIAIGASAQGDEKFGRVITQALAPADQSRLSVSERWAFQWSWQTITGASPQGGLIAVSGEHHLGNKWWFIYTGGIYFSNDGGKTLTNITIP